MLTTNLQVMVIYGGNQQKNIEKLIESDLKDTNKNNINICKF